MKQKLLILLLSLLWIMNNVAKAQDTEFWFVAPDVSEAHGPNCDGPTYMVISNPGDNPVTVVVTTENGANTEYNGSISGGGFIKLDWDLTATRSKIENPRSSAGTVVSNKSIHIKVTSGEGVLAYYMVDGSCSKDLYSLKGSNALGKEFYIPMMHDNHYYSAFASSDGFDQIDIVAAKATTITFTPTIDCVGGYTAGITYTKNLAAGDVFKLMETSASAVSQTGPTLAGTKITSSVDDAIAITVTEDCCFSPGAIDVIGDQIVPISCAGTSYIVIKGYSSSPATDRLYFTATKSGTTHVTVIGDGGFSRNLSLTGEGSTDVVDLGISTVTPNSVYVVSDKPVYCYQVSAYGNEVGSALIPSMYSISQRRLAFYDAPAPISNNNIFLVFRTGKESNFTINGNPLTVTPINLPTGAPTEWKYAKLEIPSTYSGQTVIIENTESPFSLGYFNYDGGATSSYGYISGFGNFRLDDTIYQCPGTSGTQLDGGYAKSYKWKYSPDGTTYTQVGTSVSCITNNDGYYAVEMDQDPIILRDTAFVRILDFKEAGSVTSPAAATNTLGLVINPILTSDPNLSFSYEWEFNDGGTTTTQTTTTPSVNHTWTTDNRSATVSITASANSHNSTGSCSATVQWYSIIYNLDGGSIDPTATQNPKIYTDSTQTFTLTNPTKEGYTFAGWSGTDLTGNTNTSVSVTQGSTGNRTYTANWTRDDYTITYELHDGTVALPGNPATYTVESPTINIINPTKTGYTFLGWSGTDLPTSSEMTVTIPTGSTGNRSYEAHWSNPNSYTITYIMPAEAIHPRTPAAYTYEDNITIQNPTLYGYTFTGWTITNDSASSPAISPNIGVSWNQHTIFGNLTLDANNLNNNWSKITYNITYNLNGGTHGTNHPNTYTVTDNVTVDIPTRLGYTFAGWTITSDSISSSVPSSGNPTTFGPGSNVFGNLTFTANWSTDQYMITYVPGAADATLDNPPANNPTTYDITNTPIGLDNGGANRNGYTFTGWIIVSDDATNPAIPTGMTIPANTVGNLTCTAQWTLNGYNITYTLPVGVTHPQTPPTYNVTQNVAIADPSAPGFTFKGWTITNDESASPAISPTKNVSWTPNTIFGNLNFSVVAPSDDPNNPNWEENVYNITYVYNGGTAPATPNPTTYTVTTPSITLNAPVRSGYTFQGWTFVSDSPSVSIPQGTVIPTGTVGNLTCTAVWNAITYNVSYVPNDDADDPALLPASNPTTYDLDNLPQNITDPTRPHYDFTGWTGSNGVTPQTGISITPTSTGVPGDLTYNANWTKKKYNVLYDLNGGSGTVPTDAQNPYEWGTTVITLDTLAGTSRAQAVFIGWSGTATPVITTIAAIPADLGHASDTFTMSKNDTTLFAVWGEDKYGPDGPSDSIPDYLQMKIIYNQNTNPTLIQTTTALTRPMPDTTAHMPNTSAVVQGNRYGLQLNDTVIFMGWSESISNNPIVEHASDKPADLLKGGTVIPVGTANINFYVVWAYDKNKNGIPDCDEPDVDVTPEHEWPETDPDDPELPNWDPTYDEAGKGATFCGCNMTMQVVVDPDPNFERVVKLHFIGNLDKQHYLKQNSNTPIDTVYTLAKNQNLLSVPFVVDTTWSSVYDGETVGIVAKIEGGGLDTFEFKIYKHPVIESLYINAYVGTNGKVDFGVSGKVVEDGLVWRSINGQNWININEPLTEMERMSVGDGTTIRLRESNGCWETRLVFTLITPDVQRTVEIPYHVGVITNPPAGIHYISGHNDFTFTASYTSGIPLIVTAVGYYSKTEIELPYEMTDNGAYQYTIRQVVEPWNIVFGSPLSNDFIGECKIWSYNNTLYITSDRAQTADVYTLNGLLFKRLDIRTGSNNYRLPRGIYVIVIGQKHYKAIIK